MSYKKNISTSDKVNKGKSDLSHGIRREVSIVTWKQAFWRMQHAMDSCSSQQLQYAGT